MAALPRIPQQLLGHISRAPTPVGSSSVRAFSTSTPLRHASLPSKPPTVPSPTNTTSRSREAQNKPSQTRRSSPPSPKIRVTATPKIARPTPSFSNPSAPRPIQEALRATKEQEAIHAAEKREATLREGRLKRAHQREAEAIELDKKEKAIAEYQERSKTIRRIWTIWIMMMPVILVTSYYLFDRCKSSG
ncbi:hypothetical protein EDB81DRAFT_282868 [Dactylonectria macrodidyma]|uniref:Uncharacterized protein n=1 Tax=Dactylonectria macrodidyma TaxID=307937 RepID=A0A9P9FMB0_9HYPO|nr:hypothetical protein EDB81DRAFT_282868 [Dactylonectria macrodidyma]